MTGPNVSPDRDATTNPALGPLRSPTATPIARPSLPTRPERRRVTSSGNRRLRRPTTITRFVRRAADRHRRRGVGASGLVLEVGLTPFSHASFFLDGTHEHVAVGSQHDGAAPVAQPDSARIDHALPHPDGRFAVALCIDTLGRVDEPESLLAELNRVLTTDGVLYLVSPLTVGARRPFLAGSAEDRRGLNGVLESSGFSMIDHQPVRDRDDYALVAGKTRALAARFVTPARLRQAG